MYAEQKLFYLAVKYRRYHKKGGNGENSCIVCYEQASFKLCHGQQYCEEHYKYIKNLILSGEMSLNEGCHLPQVSHQERDSFNSRFARRPILPGEVTSARQNGACPCPVCGQTILKTDACNHMTHNHYQLTKNGNIVLAEKVNYCNNCCREIVYVGWTWRDADNPTRHHYIGDDVYGQCIYNRIRYYDDGGRYEGQWENDKRHGQGIYYYSGSRGRYEGQWKDDKKDGQGTRYYTGGEKYEGHWKADKLHGQGTYYYADGGRYQGHWESDKRQGQGTRYYTDGGRYEGQWENDKMQGQGTYYYSDGSKYEGQWENGKMHGQGTCHYTNGDVYKGQWENDEMHGQGTCYYTNGDVYKGEWKNDEMHGQGTCHYADGGRYEGQWEHNKRQG